MSSSVRARHGARGFSFVELLVTILIAGLAFAAMVPLFVDASQVGQGDRARVTAANIAQDRIEKIRQLDWDSITIGNLNSPTFWVANAFGETTATVGEDGTGKTYDVRYTVDDVIVPPEDSRVSYKVVTVEVDWKAPPAPVKTVVLRTVIYPQWAGPQMIGLLLQPYVPGLLLATDVGDFRSEKWLTAGDRPASGSPLVISAFINLNDVVYMTSPAGVTPATSGRVEISISGPGLSLPTQKIKIPYAGNLAMNEYRYSWDWLAGGAQDGIYTIQAVGYSYKGFRGNAVVDTVRIDTGAPQPVTILTSSGIDGTASFTWFEANSGDLQSYEVTRQAFDGSGNLVGSPERVAGGWNVIPVYTSTGFTDSGLSNGTTYRFSIVAIDQLNQRSTPTVVDIRPELSTVPRPEPPGSASAVPSLDAARVSWAASPSLGVVGYNVYQTDAAGNNRISVGYYPGAAGGSTVPDVLQGYSSTYHYQVTALVTGTGFPTSGESDYSPVVMGVSDPFGGVLWARVTTGARPTYRIRLYNVLNQSRNMRLLFLGRFGLDAPVLVQSWPGVGGRSYTAYLPNQVPGHYKIESQRTSPASSPWVPMQVDSPPPDGTTLTGVSGDYTINVQ